jgi:NitT/TauT family transport system substrate-binding protein
VQAVVQTWFDTTAWIKANPAAAIDIMAERGGVSAADYKSYDAGTTIFTRQQNLDAFAPGSTPAHLDYQASRSATFCLDRAWPTPSRRWTGCSSPRFVQAVTE